MGSAVSSNCTCPQRQAPDQGGGVAGSFTGNSILISSVYPAQRLQVCLTKKLRRKRQNMTHSLCAALPHREFGADGKVLLSFWNQQLDCRLKGITRRRDRIKQQSSRPMLIVNTEDCSPFA